MTNILNSDLKEKFKKIGKKFNLNLFVLFGSRAKGNFNENSDWDFAYFSTKNIDEEKLELELFKLLKGKAFDLINISNPTNPELEFRIFNEGVVLYEKNKNLFLEFKLQSYFSIKDGEILLNKTRDKFLAA